MNRPYQEEQLKAIKQNYEKGVTQQVVSAATGTGKTHVFAQIPALMKHSLPGQTLILAHRNELIDQSIKKLREINPTLKVGKEKAEERADTESDILVCSVATVGRKNSNRLSRFNIEKLDKVITDECHHSSATSYLNIYESLAVLGNTKKLHVGFTATPQRADGKALAKIFRKIVHEYNIRQAIEDGWLVDVKGIRVKTSTNLDNVKTTAGDFQEDELADTINTPERNKLAVETWLKNTTKNYRQTVVFCSGIQHAKDMAKAFNDAGVAAEAIWGNDHNRDEKLKAHKNLYFPVICNCGILIEGYDDWQISCILLARPTKSGTLYVQMVGRGTRIQDGTGNLKVALDKSLNYGNMDWVKQDCLVIDMVDVSNKHSLITLPTLMGLSSALDLSGKSLVGAIKLIEQAQEDYPHLDFNSLKDIDQLESYIEQVDFFSIKPVPEVEDNSELIWHRSADNGYILLLSKTDQIKITQNLLDKYELKGTISGQKFKGERESLADIFSAADDLVYKYAPDVLKVVKRNQSWQNLNPTEAQMHQIRKWYKNKPLPPNLTRGSASIIIGRHLAKKG